MLNPGVQGQVLVKVPPECVCYLCDTTTNDKVNKDTKKNLCIYGQQFQFVVGVTFFS